MTDSQTAPEPGERAPDPTPTTPPFAAARDSARTLATAAQWVQFGTVALGIAHAIHDVRTGWSFGIVTSLLAYGIVGLAAGRLLVALARIVETHAERAEAAARTAHWCETTLGPAVTRLIETLQRSGLDTAARGPRTPDDARAQITALRQAIAASEWAVAEQHVRDFAVAYPEHPETARLSSELAERRESAAHDLRTRLDAARAANDPDRVLELREGLALLLAGESLHDLDRELSQWFLQVIQKRLRAGGVRPEIPVLAARIADALDATPAGASLRAALPTLRRSAGLCARCGEPYAGIADACPKCLAHATPAPPPPSAVEPAATDEDDDVADGIRRDDDPFIRDESE